MKFLHTSDLHLGRKLLDVDTSEDQKFMLDQIVDIAVDNKVDAILVAGDIYDKDVPRVEATKMLDDFIKKLHDKNIKLVMISGNHDQADRLAFGNSLFEKSGIYISDAFHKDMGKLVFNDEYGDINIYLLPFIRPDNVISAYYELKDDFLQEKENQYELAVSKAIEMFNVDYSQRNVIVSHQFIKGSLVCDSETKLVVGGTDQVSIKSYEKFDYVALGHLHRPQKVEEKNYIRYSGSPNKLSFSEADYKKLCYIIDMKEKGNVDITEVEIKQNRDMIVLKGSFDDLLNDEEKIEKYKDWYVKIELSDEKTIYDAKERLKIKYNNLLDLSFTNIKVTKTENNLTEEIIEEKSMIELLKDFYKMQKGDESEMSEEQEAIIKEILDEIEKGKVND